MTSLLFFLVGEVPFMFLIYSQFFFQLLRAGFSLHAQRHFSTPKTVKSTRRFPPISKVSSRL